MKIACLTAAGMLAIIALATPVQAQDKKEPALGEYDQIIIKRKGDDQSKKNKEVKLSIVIKDDRIEVNGKPIAEFDDERVAVLKRDVIIRDGARARVAVTGQARSPFQGSGVQSFRAERDPIIQFNSGNAAFLGVSTEKSEKGALITNITKESAAAKAGLKTGDIITKINDIKVESPESLTAAIGKFKPEDKVKVGFLRDGKAQAVTASLGKREQTFTFNGRVLDGAELERAFDFEGLKGGTYNFSWPGAQPKLGIKAQDTDDGKGVKVLEVDAESAAEKAGVKAGDIITSFDGRTINSVDELLQSSRVVREEKKISLPIEIQRDGAAQKLELKIPRKLKTAEL